MSANYDVIVIGSGPGGYVTAIRSAQLGFKTAIVEREHLGGICLNWGCIPTKALLRSAEIKRYADHLEDFGLTLDGTVTPDINAIVERSRQVSARLNSGIGFLMKKNKIDVIWGEATISDKGKIVVRKPSRSIVQQHPIPKEVGGEGEYTARHTIIATGARPRSLSGIEPDGKLICTYYDAMVPETLPQKLLIMGAGAIGIEFATFYNAMGCDVTVVELMPQILPTEDLEIAEIARENFAKAGIKILTEAQVTHVEKTSNSVNATIETSGGKAQLIETDRLISAVGVRGNIENLGLEELGLETDRGSIVTDGYGRTNVEGIYAIGDVAGPPLLAHKAEHEGIICIEKIAGVAGVHQLDKSKIPGCTYCNPQVASIGMTEAKAREAGFDIRIGRFPFGANGKAIALGEDQGLVKTIFDKKSGQLLGAHMIGAEVTELIQGFVVAINLEVTEEELIHSVFPHPTLSEVMKESVLDAFGRVLNA